MIEIPLSKTGKNAGKYTAIVSLEDADLAELNWSVRSHPRVHHAFRSGTKSQKPQYLHRVIMERMLGHPIPEGLQVDHISGDALNNCRENLRLATKAQNGANRGKQRNSTSGYKGVSKPKKAKKWHAQIQVDGKNISLGTFDTPEEAHAIYCKAADKYFGEFANYGDAA